MTTQHCGSGATALVKLHALREEVAHEIRPLLGRVEERRRGGGDAEHVTQHRGVIRWVVIGQLEKADRLRSTLLITSKIFPLLRAYHRPDVSRCAVRLTEDHLRRHPVGRADRVLWRRSGVLEEHRGTKVDDLDAESAAEQGARLNAP